VQTPNHPWRKLAGAFAVAAALSCGGGGGQTAPFHITIRYMDSASGPGGLSDAQKTALEAARARLEKVVLNSMSVVDVDNACKDDVETLHIQETVSGLLILVKKVDLGDPNILASSGPCVLRGQTHYPLVAVLDVNSDATMTEQEFRNVALHEMIHTLGFGTLWGPPDPVKGFGFDLIHGIGTPDVEFEGKNALLAAQTLNRNSVSPGWTTVPVEEGGQEGTVNDHWRKSVFDNELMTGYVDVAAQPLSATTIQSLADLGYSVDVSQADPYTIPEPGMAHMRSVSTARPYGDDVMHVRPVEVDEL
jgi:hypothetical protein